MWNIGMISVIVPTLNDEQALVATLASLVPAAADGSVRDVLVVDGGSSDGTERVAEGAGCVFLRDPASRAERLIRGVAHAKGPWLLFLAPGAELQDNWFWEARVFIERAERQGSAGRRAAVFRFAVDDFGARARGAEVLVGLRGVLTGRSLAEQGLLIHHSFYGKLGGIRPLAALEDFDLFRRIGPRHLVRLRSRLYRPEPGLAPSDAKHAGLRRALGLGLFALRLPPRLVARIWN